MFGRRNAALGAALVWGSASALAAPAFPGAEGYGAVSVGGRGGAVFEVTSLADSGPGTLRACVEASGPRTCVFRVSGTIENRDILMITNPFITIAGQTAPGGGVQVKIAARPVRGVHTLIAKGTHDVIVRHLRLRPGFDRNNPAFKRGSIDAFGVETSYAVIVDHADLAWSADENFNAHLIPSRAITVQDSLLYEGLRDHSRGALTCSDSTGGCGGVTFVRNAFHSNDRRNPSIPNDGRTGCVDFVNNVVSNPVVQAVEVWDNHGGAAVNIVGNTFKRGPNTGSAAAIHNNEQAQFPGINRIHAAGNTTVGMPLAAGTVPTQTAPVCPLSVAAQPAAAAYDRVLATAGAWPRDSVGSRVVDEIRNGRGRILFVAPGWPTPAPGTAPADGDRDGMPDAWERANGLNHADAADRNLDRDRDGFTELEEYLDARHREVMATAPAAPARPN